MVKADKAFKWGIAIVVIFGILNAFFFLNWTVAFKIILPILCVFLIGAILLQSGKGGGLAAIGGLGDQAAFGTRTSSFLTQVTYLIGAAFIVATIFLFKLSSPVGDIDAMISHEHAHHEHGEECDHDHDHDHGHDPHTPGEGSDTRNAGLKEMLQESQKGKKNNYSETNAAQSSRSQATGMNFVENVDQPENAPDAQAIEDEGTNQSANK